MNIFGGFEIYEGSLKNKSLKIDIMSSRKTQIWFKPSKNDEQIHQTRLEMKGFQNVTYCKL